MGPEATAAANAVRQFGLPRPRMCQLGPSLPCKVRSLVRQCPRSCQTDSATSAPSHRCAPTNTPFCTAAPLQMRWQSNVLLDGAGAFCFPGLTFADFAVALAFFLVA